MYHRLINPSKNMSFFLFGARGTGKSTWLQSQFDVEENLWVDLSNPQTERRYARRPEIMLDEYKAFTDKRRHKSELHTPWIVVDEVQKIPQILDVAHMGIQRHKIPFALTGSSARKLKRGAANLLAGRALSYRMFPLTYREMGEHFDFNHYLHRGGLPMLHHLAQEDDQRVYLRSYVDTYLREEIQIEQLVRKIEPFRMFLDVVGQMNGEIINIAKIAKEAGIDPKSGERYFEILADTLLGFYLPSYDRSIRKTQLRHPKFYLFDVGVARAVRNELPIVMESHTTAYGRAFEHFLIQQIWALNSYTNKNFRLSFFRTKDDNEVDLVIERPALPTIFLEIKSTDRPETLSLRNLASLAADAQSEAIVACNALRPLEIDGIRILPWREAIDYLFD